MTWNSLWPIGTISVKQNRTTGNQNTLYIETTMGNAALAPVGKNLPTTVDHFWNVSSDLNGHHRFIKMPAFVAFDASIPPVLVTSDPEFTTGIDGVLYLRTCSATVADIQGFYRNNNANTAKIYQFIPSFLEATVSNIIGSYTNVVAVPNETYGEIYMFTTIQGKYSSVRGFFRATAGVTEAWTLVQSSQNDDSAIPLKFANGSDAIDLNIKARAEDASSGQNWNYKITYRAL